MQPVAMKRLLCVLVFALLQAASLAQIDFWAVTGSVKDVAMYDKLASDFRQKSGIEVKVTPLAWGSFETKFFAAMAAGIPPDIGMTNLGGPFNYGSVGGLVNFDTAFPEEAKQLRSMVNADILNICTVNGGLVGIPADLSTVVLYYRTDIFQKLGLSAPKTWSELNHAIDVLEANRYRYYYGFTYNAQWALGLYTWPFDKPGKRMNANGEPELLWNDPLYQKGILQALDLWFMHNPPGQDLGNRLVGMFKENKPEDALPLVIDQSGLSGRIQIIAPELKGMWDMIPWPKADDGKEATLNGGTAYVIFRKSKKQKEAMQWLMYINSAEVQKQIILSRADRADESSLFISPIREVWEKPDPDFWAKPILAPELRTREVVASVFNSFRNEMSVNGEIETGRMEANLLDQMNSFIQERINALADKAKISKTELFQRFGRGAMAQERSQLKRDIAEKLKAEYAKIQPQAEAILKRETARYDQRYGEISRNLATYEAKGNALQVVKWIVGLLMLAGVVAVASVPKLRRHAISYAFISVPLMLAIIFVFTPALTALYLSFTDYHPVLPLSTASWVGTTNYSNAFASGDLWQAIAKTTKYTLLTVPIGIFISLGIAFLLSQKLRAQSLWRFLHFSPLVTSVVSVALIFNQLFLSGKQGWVNALLFKLGVINDPIPWLASDQTFLNCVILLAIWSGLAFSTLVFVAALQQIPIALFEAAALDGASPVKRFWKIAIPGIRPQVFFISVVGIIGAFQVFETIYVLANKSGNAGARFGVNDSALTMVPLIYHTGFEKFEMGSASAIAYVLFVFILIITAIQFAIQKRSMAAE